MKKLLLLAALASALQTADAAAFIRPPKHLRHHTPHPELANFITFMTGPVGLAFYLILPHDEVVRRAARKGFGWWLGMVGIALLVLGCLAIGLSSDATGDILSAILQGASGT